MPPQYTQGREWLQQPSPASGYVLSASNPTGRECGVARLHQPCVSGARRLGLERQDIINTDLVEPGTEIAAWLEAFRRLGYCILEPGLPRLAKDTQVTGLQKAALTRSRAAGGRRSRAS